MGLIMRISVIGCGYVGLVSGACLADFGHIVTCVDVSTQKIDLLNAGHMPIFEPSLEALVADNVKAGRLTFTCDLPASVADADVVIIAVGTPPRQCDGHADLSHVYAAAAAMGRLVTGFTVVVVKSTVPVGTGDMVESIITESNPDADVAVVSNPEFLREGAAIHDFKHPDRIIVGLEDERAREPMTELYRPLQLGAPMFTGRRTAELIKYASNAFLAMKITFINEMADLCEKVGSDVRDVAHGMGLDSRIGAEFLNAGPGYGGSCFPKDTVALAKTAQDHSSPLRLVETTIAVNEQRKRAMGRRVISAMGGSVRGKIIGILGLTFKANTDDMREAPSLAIIQSLLDAGARIQAFDPEGMTVAQSLMPQLAYAEDAYGAAKDADCVVLVTGWNAFRALDLERLRQVMAGADLVDLRNIYSRKQVEAHGLRYTSIGQPAPAEEMIYLAAE